MDVYSHFGLSGPPFSVTPDPRFAYETQEHRLALVKIAYSVAERRGLFLLQGEIGTGKTTLSRLLTQTWSQDPERYAVAHVNSPVTRSPAGFLREILAAFRLPTTRNLSALNQTLLEFLVECYRQGKAVVLFLDEAQQIAVPNLDLLHNLSNMQTVEHQLLQLVLFAQPNIEYKLDQRPALRSRITGGAYLGPLSFEDAQGMLRHRVGVVGGDFDRLFLPDTHKPIFNAAKGIPRELCVCADASLVRAYAAERTTVNAEDVAGAIQDMRFKKWQTIK